MEGIMTISAPLLVGSTLASIIPREPGYLRLLSFIVSSARQGEIVAVENYSEMVALMPDTAGKIETVTQAKEECKHILLLEKLAGYVGFPICESVLESQWQTVRHHFQSAARKRNLAGCLIIQHLMVESVAIGLYQVFASSTNGDAGTQHIAANLLQDELDHLKIGIRQIQRLMDGDSGKVHDSLLWAHHRVMPSLFEVVQQSCDFLRCNKELDCDAVDGHSYSVEIESLKVASHDHYVAMLNQVGFESRISNQLIASMCLL